MKVTCPHCGAGYAIDDRRIPSSGLNVKCPKCSGSFPVKREAAEPPPAPAADSIPLPSPASPFGAFPPVPPFADGGAHPPPPPADPFSSGPQAGSIPLPAPGGPFAPPPGEEPFSFGPAPDADPLPAPDSPFGAPPVSQPDGPVGFGEIEFEQSSPAPPSPLAPDPFVAAPIQGSIPPAPTGEELEDLFGEAKKKGSAPPPVAPAASGPLSMDKGFQVRRRSGKVFGPFPPEAIAEMLQKGELQGNEDVSSDGGESWQPMRGVAQFRDAAGKANAPPPQPVPAAPSVPYGSRMAPAKLGEGGGVELRTRPPWLKGAVAAAVVLLLAGVGVAGSFTRFGPFFYRAFRSQAERSRVAGIVQRAKAGLARGDFAGEKEALKLAGDALAAAPDEVEAQLAFVIAASALERRHAAAADATLRAAATAKGLADDARGSPAALAADLAQSLGSGDVASLSQRETALEQAIAKEPPDPELVALLARAALARKDGARAAAQFKRLDALQPGTTRAALGGGLALVAQGKSAEALPIFEKALAADGTLSEVRVDGAAAAVAAGDLEKAKALLAPLLDPAPLAALAPLDRARALTVSASLLPARAADRQQVEKLLADAVAADGRFGAARVALANHRLRCGDPAGAVAATDPAAAEAARTPELAEVRIRALVGAGRALDAATLADAALAAAPGTPRLLLARGMVQEQIGKIAEAAVSYRDAIARAPADWEPRVALARLAMAGKDLTVAQTEIAAAVERSPGAPSPLAALGELDQAKGDAAGAEAAFRRALALDDEHAPALVGLARVALARGDAAAARASVDRALAVDPGRTDARRLRGELLWKAGDLDGAVADFKAATVLAPGDAVGFTRYGAVLLLKEDLAAAIRALENATGLAPTLAEPQYWLGRALLAKGELPGAQTRLRRAIELDPAVAAHHLWLGIAMERVNTLAEAVEEYRAAAAADPKLGEAWERIGNIYAAAGRCDEAVPAFEKALAASPGALRNKIAIGDCRERQGKHDDALRIYREVLKAEPKSAAVPFKMARALHESKGVKDAVPWYERAIREEPENPMPYYYLGFAYKDRGQRARAVQLFKQYLVKRPDAEDRKDIEQEIEDLGG